MKRKMKKVTALFLSLAMVMGMAGCSMEKRDKGTRNRNYEKRRGGKENSLYFSCKPV